MKLFLAQLTQPKAIAAATNLRNYGGVMYCVGVSQLDQVPSGQSMIVDDEGAGDYITFAQGPQSETDERWSGALDRLLAMLKDPRMRGFYAAPAMWNKEAGAPTHFWQWNAFATLGLVGMQPMSFPSFYPQGRDTAQNQWFIDNGLYVALSMHETVVPFIHPRMRSDEAALTASELETYARQLAAYRHPRNGRKIAGLYYWTNGDTAIRRYANLDPNAMYADANMPAAIKKSKLNWPNGFADTAAIDADCLAEQMATIGVIGKVLR